MGYIAQWALAFVLTEAVEVPIVVGLARGAPLAQRAAAAFFATLSTHPIVWFVLPELGLTDATRLGASELWAFAAECVFYRLLLAPIGWRRAAATSAVANFASFVLGLLVIR